MENTEFASYMNTFNAQKKTAKYFLKIKGHTQYVRFTNWEKTKKDKTGKLILTSPQHQYSCLRRNHCL